MEIAENPSEYSENRSQSPSRIATCFFVSAPYTLSTEGGAAVVVYIDGVFVLNLAVNYLLLYGAGRLGGAGIRRLRLLAGAAVGAAYAVAVYLPHCQWLTFPLWKLLCAALMLLAAYGGRPATLRLGAVFFALSLALCGAVYGVQLLQNGQLRYQGSELFFPVSFFTLLLTAFAVSSACYLLLPRLTHSPDSIVPLTLRLGKRQVSLSALRDSGNTLQDPISGDPVLTVYWYSARTLLPPGLNASDFEHPATLLLRLKDLSPRLIPYRAVGVSSGLLLALPCEILVENRSFSSLVAFSPTPVSDGGAYEALTGGNLYV